MWCNNVLSLFLLLLLCVWYGKYDNMQQQQHFCGHSTECVFFLLFCFFLWFHIPLHAQNTIKKLENIILSVCPWWLAKFFRLGFVCPFFLSVSVCCFPQILCLVLEKWTPKGVFFPFLLWKILGFFGLVFFWFDVQLFKVFKLCALRLHLQLTFKWWGLLKTWPFWFCLESRTIGFTCFFMQYSESRVQSCFLKHSPHEVFLSSLGISLDRHPSGSELVPSPLHLTSLVHFLLYPVSFQMVWPRRYRQLISTSTLGGLILSTYPPRNIHEIYDEGYSLQIPFALFHLVVPLSTNQLHFRGY